MNTRQAFALFGVAIIVSLLAASCGGGGSHTAALSITTTTLPAGLVGNTYGATLSATGGKTPYSWSLASGSLPAGVNMGSSGSLSGTPTTAGQYNFTAQVTDSNAPQAMATQALTITVNPAPPPLELNTSSLSEGVVNVAYSATFQATGGVTPYTFTVTSGTLPRGLTLSSAGVISGTPREAGVSNFMMQVADAENPPMKTNPTAFTITIAGTPLTITTTTLPDAVLNVPYATQLQVSGGIPPYTWQEQNFGGGSDFWVTSNGEVTTTFHGHTSWPKKVGTVSGTVQVMDAGQGVATQTLTVTTNVGGNALLNGPYTFQASGFASGGTSQWAVAGSFVADGNGNITSGEIDSNSTASGPLNSAIAGTYSIAPNGLGTMTLNTTSSSMTFAFAMSSGHNDVLQVVTTGQIIEFDDASGQGSRASGVITQQGSNLVLAGFAGGYAFAYSGQDAGSANRLAEVGEFSLDANGGISNGAGDANYGGIFNSFTLSGNMAALDSAGRSLATLTVTVGGVQHDEQYAVYVNNGTVTAAPKFCAVRIDPINNSGQLLSGTLRQQALINKIDNSSLNGILVLQASGVLPGQDPSGVAAAGLSTFDGAGNVGAVDIEQNVGGTFTNFTTQGFYSVSSNGRVVITTPGLPGIGYLVSPDQMVAMSGNPDASLAYLIQQNPNAPFSNASLTGYTSAGSLAPVQSNVTNSVFQLTADGTGNLTGLADSSGPNGLQSNVSTTITYSINAAGKSQLSGSVGGYMYVGADAFIVVTDETNPRLLTIVVY